MGLWEKTGRTEQYILRWQYLTEYLEPTRCSKSQNTLIEITPHSPQETQLETCLLIKKMWNGKWHVSYSRTKIKALKSALTQWYSCCVKFSAKEKLWSISRRVTKKKVSFGFDFSQVSDSAIEIKSKWVPQM